MSAQCFSTTMHRRPKLLLTPRTRHASFAMQWRARCPFHFVFVTVTMVWLLLTRLLTVMWQELEDGGYHKLVAVLLQVMPFGSPWCCQEVPGRSGCKWLDPSPCSVALRPSKQSRSYVCCFCAMLVAIASRVGSCFDSLCDNAGVRALPGQVLTASEPLCYVVKAIGFYCCHLGVALHSNHIAGRKNHLGGRFEPRQDSCWVLQQQTSDFRRAQDFAAALAGRLRD